MEEIRINKYIASSGICSRRNADELIISRRVKVNGKIVTELGTQVKINDIVEVDNQIVCVEERKVYILLNKPRGYVTTAKEQFGRKAILDLIDIPERVFPVGRLDMDSEGMILLTNDGEFMNNIIHPTKHISKKYEVKLMYDITDADITFLKNGIDIGGYVTQPAEIEKINLRKLLITIREGKNRQIRKMCEAVGNKVMMLKRIAIGKLTLGNIKEGEYKILSKEDISKIFE